MNLSPTEIGGLVTVVVGAAGTLWATFGKPRADSNAALQQRVEGLLQQQREDLERRMAALEAERDALERRLETVERELNDMRYDLRTWQDYGRDVVSGRFDITQAQARANELLSRTSPPPPTTGGTD